MGVGGRRISVEIVLAGQTQSGTLPLTLYRINHLIVTSTEEGQTFKLSLTNERGDLLIRQREVAPPDSNIRQDLIPIGPLTITIEDPVPASGTVTIVAILENE